MQTLARAIRTSALLALGFVAACSVQAVSFTFVDGGPGDDATIAAATARVTVRRGGSASGAVSAQGVDLSCADTCSASVAAGTSITLTATPDTGAVFAGWTGGCDSSALTCTLSITADITIDARFDIAMFTVDVSVPGTGGGVVSSTPSGLSCPDTCTLSVAYRTEVELVASPSATSTFLGWGGACSGSDVCRFIVTGNTAASATFGANQELIMSITGGGAGTVSSAPAGIACGTECAHFFAPGTVVTLSAVADPNSTFAGWAGACAGTGTCQVTMLETARVTARFELQQFPLTVAVAGNGTGTVRSQPAGITCGTDCTELYDIDALVTLTATPAASSVFAGWAGAGCTGTGSCQVTMSGAASVTASFTTITGFLAATSFSSSSIVIFPLGASGNVAPTRRIVGLATQLRNPRGITVVGSEMIVADQGAAAIDVFSVGADGNVPPLRQIVGPSTGLSDPAGILVFGGEIYVGQQSGVVSVFPLTGNGDIAPTRTITGIAEAEDLAIVDGELYVADAGAARILVFPANASGTPAPSRVISGSATGLASPVGLQVANDEIIVANASVARVSVFPRFASGNASPSRVIVGPNTSLVQALQIAVFAGEVYVTDFTTQSVDVFPLNATGNVAPVRQITGDTTLLGNVAGVCVF